jgi:hypothetical protein
LLLLLLLAVAAAAAVVAAFQSMNPLPFIAMAANCTLGMLYGQITHDWYLWVANTIGVLLSKLT